MYILYKNDGSIFKTVINDDIDAYILVNDYKDIKYIEVDDIDLGNLLEYKIIDGRIAVRPEIEVREMQQYGRVLTEEERLLNKLSPPYEEITKAKNTIEMISLMQEVMWCLVN